jgi:hypothetical protein
MNRPQIQALRRHGHNLIRRHPSGAADVQYISVELPIAGTGADAAIVRPGQPGYGGAVMAQGETLTPPRRGEVVAGRPEDLDSFMVLLVGVHPRTGKKGGIRT